MTRRLSIKAWRPEPLVRLNEDQATKLLAEKRVGRLGCVVDTCLSFTTQSD